MATVTKIVMDYNDIQPLADAVKIIGELDSSEKITLEDMIDIVSVVAENGTGGGGVTLPELSSPAEVSDVLAGKEFINEYGVKKTGNITTKTASNLTASGATVTVPAGYYANQVSKSVATGTAPNPTINVSASGVITASSAITGGYIASKTISNTKNLSTKAATTITPSKSAQTAVAANTYTTGDITVAAIPNQYEDITTPLAELNAANGGTAAATIYAAVDNAEAHASSQEAMITQIAQALEGKAGGGGSTVQTATGSFTIGNEAGEAEEIEINCGFCPDMVIVHISESYTEDGYEYVNDMCANTAAVAFGDYCICYSVVGDLDTSYWFAFGYIGKTATGFVASSFGEQELTGDYWYTNKTYAYTAIKYT